MFFYYSVKNNYLQGLYIILFIGAFIYICMSLDFLRYFIMVPEVEITLLRKILKMWFFIL